MIATSIQINDQMTDKKVQLTLLFTQLQYYCFPSCFPLSWACLNQHASTICAASQPILETHETIIPHMKEDKQSLHMILNFKSFIGKIGLNFLLFTSYSIVPRISALNAYRGVWGKGARWNFCWVREGRFMLR